MRVVLDTNVLVAAFIAHGVCHELLEHCAVHHDIVLSRFIPNEFREKMVTKFAFTRPETGRAIRLLESRCNVVTPAVLDDAICRDPDDDQIIGTAVAGSCHCIATGDKDPLDLDQVQGIRIISPSQFWAFENQ